MEWELVSKRKAFLSEEKSLLEITLPSSSEEH